MKEILILHPIFNRSFDPNNTGQISEERFIKIMKSKENVTEEDINEMIAGSFKYCI